MSEPLYVHPDGVRSYAQVHDEVVATGTSGSTISELLQKAAQMYEHGDQKRAATLRAATEALEVAQGEGAPGSPGVATNPAGASGAGASGAGGSDAIGQILGQVGQQAGQLGQMAQSVTQPLRGLLKGFSRCRSR